MILETKNNDVTFVGSKYIFTRMQVLIWCSSGTTLLHSVEKKAGDQLAQLISDFIDDKTIVINFAGIVNIDDHALDDVFVALSKVEKQLVIINGYHLLSIIDRLKKEYNITITSNSSEDWISLGKQNQVSLKGINEERKTLKEDFIKESIKKTFIKFDSKRRLHSTPILANGEYNSNLIISEIKKFMWMCFFMADRIQELLDMHRLTNVKLLTASLRGAPFAAMIGLIKKLEFETIDHFGPKHKVFDIEFLNRIEKGTNYIYIGDFCFGGTEIKIAKTYTEMKSSKLCHALVLGNLIDSIYFKDEFELMSLQSLEGLNPDAEFTL
jgi:hypothetical protein